MSSTEKPKAPEIWDCCGGGCSPCVWDSYYAELAQWELVHGEKKEVESNTQVSAIDTSDDHLFR